MTKGRNNRYRNFLIKNFHQESYNLSFYSNNNNVNESLKRFTEAFCGNNNSYILDEDSLSYPPKKIKKIYFKIERVKKRGKRRLKSNSKIHDKYSEYNIICKIKVYFTKALLNQVRNLYNKYYFEKGEQPKGEYLIPINLKEEKNENGNVDWFYKTVKEYLSSNISGKYKAHDKDFNKNRIEEIFKENKIKDLINFLGQNISSIYKEYISDKASQSEIFKGFLKAYEDLKYMKVKYNYDDEYIKEVEKILKNLEKILSDKKNKNNKAK